jgi:hypothetical protein
MASDRIALNPLDARSPQSRMVARLSELERQVQELRNSTRIQRGVYSAGAAPTTVNTAGAIPLLATMTFQAPDNDTPVFIWGSSLVTMPNGNTPTGNDNPLRAALAFRQEEVTPVSAYQQFAAYVQPLLPGGGGWPTNGVKLLPPMLGAYAYFDRPDTLAYDPTPVDQTYVYGGTGYLGLGGSPIMYLAAAGPVTLKFYAYTGDTATAGQNHNYQFWGTKIYASVGGL